MAETTSPNPNDQSVADPQGLLDAEDHMRGMERLEMEVVGIAYPVPSIARVTGRIAPQNPAAWQPPNQAIRIAVDHPEGQRPVMRVYTVRRFDPDQSLIEIDFVLHGGDSPAMLWLHSAKPGTILPLIGPRQHVTPNPTPGKRVAIFADATAIPALWSILDAWPDDGDAEGDVWVETDDRFAFDELPHPQGITLHLLLRPPEEAAGTAGRLLLAAQELADPQDRVVWAAGERQEMRALKEIFRKAGVTRDHLQVVGYWKHGISGSDLDRLRLAEYAALLSKGKTLADLNDEELPI